MRYSLLQDIRQTKEYVCFMEKIGWKVETINPPSSRQKSGLRGTNNETIKVFIKKLPFLPFSVIKVLRYSSSIQLNELKKTINKYFPILIKLEPFEIEKINNCRVYFKVLKNNKWPLTPTKTLWLNLSKSEKQILLKMKQKTRYNICLAQRKNLEVQIIPGDKITNKQLYDFYNIWGKNKPYNWFFRANFNQLKHLVESFGNKCFFILAFKNTLHCYSELAFDLSSSRRDSESIQIKSIAIDSGSCFQPACTGRPVRNDKKHQLLASCLILTSKNIAFYWHNASTDLGKKLFAPTLCVWEAIKEAKRQKLKAFDFEGVWDERFPKLNKGWKGFSKFKQGFAKQ